MYILCILENNTYYKQLYIEEKRAAPSGKKYYSLDCCCLRKNSGSCHCGSSCSLRSGCFGKSSIVTAQEGEIVQVRIAIPRRKSCFYESRWYLNVGSCWSIAALLEVCIATFGWNNCTLKRSCSWGMTDTTRIEVSMKTIVNMLHPGKDFLLGEYIHVAPIGRVAVSVQ